MRKKLVTARTPLRIGIAGGGSDLAGGPGAVVNASIDKYVYCVAKWRNDEKVYLTWSEKEVVPYADLLKHDLVREALKALTVTHGIEILTFADVPGRGSGLGSSSATTVAVLHAVRALLGVPQCEISPEWLAETAAEIEIDVLGQRIGRQDQYAAAFGGLQYLEFDDGRVCQRVPFNLPDSKIREFSDWFLLFEPPVGRKDRKAHDVLSAAKHLDDGLFRSKSVELAGFTAECIEKGRFVDIGKCLEKHHELKNEFFPDYWPKVECGSDLLKFHVPAKLCGAGVTGHILIHASPRDHVTLINQVQRVWGCWLPFQFERTCACGSKIVYTEDA